MMTQPNTPTIYLDAAELAAIVRRDLKAAFPGVTFRVRSSKYSMGSSVNVSWQDGPTAAAVNAVIDRYKAQGFDGMTDSNTNSGPVRLDDGRTVRITSFLFTNRTISPELRARVADWFHRHYDGGYFGDVEMAIERAAWQSYIVNNCLIVGRR